MAEKPRAQDGTENRDALTGIEPDAATPVVPGVNDPKVREAFEKFLIQKDAQNEVARRRA